MNRLPLLEVTDAEGNNFTIGQSAAIERLVATCLRLRGDTLVSFSAYSVTMTTHVRSI